jgi:hypothetical protein
VAQAGKDQGYENWANGTALDGFDPSLGSGNRCIQAPHAKEVVLVFAHFAALLRRIKVSFQAAIIIGSVLLA